MEGGRYEHGRQKVRGRAFESREWFREAVWRKTRKMLFFSALFAVWTGYILYGLNRKQDSRAIREPVRNIADITKASEGEVLALSEASIRKVFEISKLQAADYMYHTIAAAYGEDGETVTYYVAYEGRVKAGIDFAQIKIDIDEEKKIIFITIPEVEFQEITVDPGTMEFIFRDKKSESENIHSESYDLCLKDLREKIGQEEELRESAEKNIEAVVKGLIIPWIEQTGCGYEVEIML